MVRRFRQEGKEIFRERCLEPNNVRICRIDSKTAGKKKSDFQYGGISVGQDLAVQAKDAVRLQVCGQGSDNGWINGSWRFTFVFIGNGSGVGVGDCGVGVGDCGVGVGGIVCNDNDKRLLDAVVVLVGGSDSNA